MAKHPKFSEKTRERIVNSIPNFCLLSPDDQIRETVKLIAGDFLLFCERNLMIRDKYSNQLIPFYDVLNWEQMELIKMVAEDLATGRPIRYIVLKARQMGMSTLIEAMGYWWTSTHRFTTTVIIAHEKEATKNLYEMFRRYYEYSHPSFKPDRKYNTKQDLTFDVSDEVKKTYDAQNLPSPGLQSEIKTMVATEGKGRSSTIKFLHGSECAFWDDSADVTSAAVQAVPMAPETFIFLESTANGIGGYFYDEWNAAKRGESQFRPVFFPWHSHNEYETPNIIDDDLGDLDAEEEALYKLFEHEGYDRASWPRKIYWRRLKKKEFRTDPKKFYQEYPSTPEEAFLASGRPVFDVPMLQEMERIAVDAQKTHPYMCGDIKKVVDPETGMERIKFIEIRRVGDNDPTPLRVWWDVDRSRKYVIGVDVSEGIEVEASSGKEADFSVITVFDVLARKVVARWRGYADPDQLGEIVFNIGTYYNTALVGVEINNHGIATAAKLRNMFYRNLYMRETAEDEQFQVRTTKFGWQTNKKTKPIMISELQRSIREGDIIDLDIVFIREAMSYIRKDNGAMEAQQGQHDDCFVKGTMIETINGPRPIETIKIGDWVLTSKGYCPVVLTRARPKKVVSNIGLRGTPDHPVILNSGIVKPLNKVTNEDLLNIWNRKKQQFETLSYTKAKSIIDTQSQSDGRSEATTGVTINGSRLLSLFIGKYGLMHMVKFLMDVSYTIKTTTRSITSSIISLVSHPKSIVPIMSQIGKKLVRRFASTSIAEKLLSTETLSGLRSFAVHSAGGGTEMVHNLQVLWCHEYVANSVLVHNCVMSTSIALQMADWSPYNTEYAAKYIQKPVKRYRNATTRTTKTGQKYQGASGVAKAIERRRRSRAVHRGR